jgi:energy-coupling factor transport system substrate-specific component
VLALVAALAALAVVGRLAFAAFPNVKPTTDIVLLSGYALGGAPGFAVGAITPVVSNIFMGHGPWTPWQMVAWGGVGVGGALLARTTRGRELGRWPLALACAVAGAGFGAVMDTYQWTLAAQQDLATWIAVSGSSLPYNLAHVIGNVVFCLLIGPGLLRALSRYRRRFEVRWAAAAAAAGAVLLVLALAPAASASSAPAAKRATAWLVQAQNRDGGFGSSPGQASGALYSGWASLGLAAGGRNPRDVERRGHSAIDYIRSHVKQIRDVGEVERTILAVEAAGLSARDFAGRDFVARLNGYRRADGSISGFISYTAFGILALRAAGNGGTDKPTRWLARQQNGDGGFGLSPGAQSDVDNTGAAMQALVAAGRRGPLDDAIAYLRRAQNSDGGFGQYEGRSSNAQSTAYAVQGLAGAGRLVGRFRKNDHSPMDYLRARQNRDGSVDYSRVSSQTPVWVTAQAVMALNRSPLPLNPPPRKVTRSANASSATNEADAPPEGGGGGKREPDKPSARAGEASKPPARRSNPWTGYAPVNEETVPPATGPRDPDPDWLGVALTLAAAGLAYYAGRRLRRASVSAKRTATAV